MLKLNEREEANIDLGLHFTDPDGDPLTFEATSSDTRVVTVSVTGSVVTIMAVSPGTADVTVTATDAAGLTAAQTFSAATEPPPNRAPLVSAPMPDQTLKLNESEKASIDLGLHFTDPDGDPLTFEATSSNTQVATVSVSNSTVTLLARDLGRATIRVAANDPDGLAVAQAFSVIVEQGRLSAELEVTKCQADGVGFVNVTVEGTVRAVAPLSSVQVTAYMDTQKLGEQTLGDLETGETRGFLIQGSVTWSRWFGQLEGLVKVYSDCEITPSSSSAPALTGGCHGWHEAGSYPIIDNDDALWNCGNLAAGAQAWAAALAREISNGLWAPASPPSGFSATVSGRPQAGQVHIAGWDMVLGPLMR